MVLRSPHYYFLSTMSMLYLNLVPFYFSASFWERSLVDLGNGLTFKKIVLTLVQPFCWNWTHREIQRKFNTVNLNFLGKLRSGNEELAVDRTQPHYIGKELRWKDVIRILSGSAPQINVQSWSAYPHHWCAIWNASGIWIRLSHTSRL